MRAASSPIGLTIDGQPVSARRHAARSLGGSIPTICDHDYCEMPASAADLSLAPVRFPTAERRGTAVLRVNLTHAVENELVNPEALTNRGRY